MESPHLLFNIHSPEEWNTELIPKLRVIISDDIEMMIIKNITYLDFESSLINWTEDDGTKNHCYFEDLIILDDEDRIQVQKTAFLKELHDHIF